jgi:hypothetical protein
MDQGKLKGIFCAHPQNCVRFRGVGASEVVLIPVRALVHVLARHNRTAAGTFST